MLNNLQNYILQEFDYTSTMEMVQNDYRNGNGDCQNARFDDVGKQKGDCYGPSSRVSINCL